MLQELNENFSFYKFQHAFLSWRVNTLEPCSHLWQILNSNSWLLITLSSKMIIAVQRQSGKQSLGHLVLWQQWEYYLYYLVVNSAVFGLELTKNSTEFSVVNFGNTLWKSVAQVLWLDCGNNSCQVYQCFCCCHSNQCMINILNLLTFSFQNSEKFSCPPHWQNFYSLDCQNQSRCLYQCKCSWAKRW